MENEADEGNQTRDQPKYSANDARNGKAAAGVQASIFAKNVKLFPRIIPKFGYSGLFWKLQVDTSDYDEHQNAREDNQACGSRKNRRI
jgi:hypothetical protein